MKKRVTLLSSTTPWEGVAEKKASWEPLGSLWGSLWPSRGALGRLSVVLEASLEALEALFGLSWALLGALETLLGLILSDLGSLRHVLVCSLEEICSKDARNA